MPPALRYPFMLLALGLALHGLGWLAEAHGWRGAAVPVLAGSALATGGTLLLLVRLHRAAPPLG